MSWLSYESQPEAHKEATLHFYTQLPIQPPPAVASRAPRLTADPCTPRYIHTCALVPALFARIANTLPLLSTSMPGSQHRSHTLVVWECSTDDRYLVVMMSGREEERGRLRCVGEGRREHVCSWQYTTLCFLLCAIKTSTCRAVLTGVCCVATKQNSTTAPEGFRNLAGRPTAPSHSHSYLCRITGVTASASAPSSHTPAPPPPPWLLLLPPLLPPPPPPLPPLPRPADAAAATLLLLVSHTMTCPL